ncbi:MAG: 4Fe-4S dicluster domain-containing protein [Desulfobacterales bacterium]|nr:4Fe-4S dicluster domain-containing protein [Desulfobacterales bacterium]
MSESISRRSFLKGGVAAAGSAAALAVPSAAAAGSDGRGQLATLLDIRKCIGCGACVEACRQVNSSKAPEPQKPFPEMYPSRVPVEDWSDKRDVRDRLTPYNLLFIQQAEVEVDGKKETLTIPRRCMHCVNPPCVNLCPWGAARQYKNGISRIDYDVCLGGSKCRKVCPWHIPQRQTGVGLYLDIMPSFAGNGVMYKCDRCYERVAVGKKPACIEACPADVQQIGPRADIIARAHELAEETGGYIYGETENGGTNTIYVSPVPFEELNAAIEKGPGRPHFASAANSMDKAENLTAAMIIAPFAAIAAAGAKFYGYMKSGQSDNSQGEA